MAPLRNGSSSSSTTTSQCMKKEANRGAAWTADEDQRLAQVIASNGPKRWKTIAAKAGLNRCGKSCRLRWMNYLRPNIKRGNISDQEEDLILRLHKLLGNRWSLIAGRLPGRTDNEIKNYWNSHLSRKIKQKEYKQHRGLKREQESEETIASMNTTSSEVMGGDAGIMKGSHDHYPRTTVYNDSKLSFFGEDNAFFDCSSTIDHREGLSNLDWLSEYLFDMDHEKYWFF